MSEFRANFEKELKAKLQQKSKSNQSEETYLVKSFKYFDLDNSGSISKNEFLKAIEKIGIPIFNPQDFFDLFKVYDQDGSGELDYKEFASALFQDEGSQQNSPTKSQKMSQSNVYQKSPPSKKNQQQQMSQSAYGQQQFQPPQQYQQYPPQQYPPQQYPPQQYPPQQYPPQQYPPQQYPPQQYPPQQYPPQQYPPQQYPPQQQYQPPPQQYQGYQQQPPPQQQQKKPAKKTQKMFSKKSREILNRIKIKLASRGAKGFIGLQRQFRIMDDDGDFEIEYEEFHKAMRDYRVGLTEDETLSIYKDMDVDSSGTVSIDELIRAIIGEMNSYRVGLVMEAFDKMDKDGSGDLTIKDLKGVYNAKFHPDVKSGKKTEDDILNEFLETFEMHHNMRGGTNDHIINKEEFIEYYNNISANIDNDQYFLTMIVNAYKLYETNPAYSEFAPANKRGTYGQQKRQPPFGTDEQPTSYTTANRPQTAQSQVTNQQVLNAQSGEQLVEIMRKKILARGTRGILQMGKFFKIVDDDNDKLIEPSEWKKVCKDLRLGFNDKQVDTLFLYFDRDGSGAIDYDEFLMYLRGEMNNFRKNIVKQAFSKLDKDGSGEITVDDLHGVFNAKNHPDVKKGKKTEDEVLMDWLDTFEQHHALKIHDQKGRDHIVTFDEFIDYYNNVSASIDDDEYFKVMITNAWNLDNKGPAKKGSRFDM